MNCSKDLEKSAPLNNRSDYLITYLQHFIINQMTRVGVGFRAQVLRLVPGRTPECRLGLLLCSSAWPGLKDYPQVDMLGFWYKSVNFGPEKSPSP